MVTCENVFMHCVFMYFGSMDTGHGYMYFCRAYDCVFVLAQRRACCG